jgi:hypothetical protein
MLRAVVRARKRTEPERLERGMFESDRRAAEHAT